MLQLTLQRSPVQRLDVGEHVLEPHMDPVSMQPRASA